MNRFIVGLTVCFLLFPGLLKADPVVDPVIQMADTQDASGLWIWTELTVVWSPDPFTFEQIGDHNPIDDDVNQDWFVPYRGDWWHFTFQREVKGEYAIRWKQADSSWSDAETCVIRPPDAAKHKDPSP